MESMSKIELGYLGIGAVALATGNVTIGLAGMAGFAIALLVPSTHEHPKAKPSPSAHPSIHNLDARVSVEQRRWPAPAQEYAEPVVLAAPLVRCLLERDAEVLAGETAPAWWRLDSAGSPPDEAVMPLTRGEDVFPGNGRRLPHRTPVLQPAAA